MKHVPAFAVTALAVTLAACGGSSTSDTKAPDAAKPAAAEATTAPVEPTAVPATEAPKGVTMAQFQQLTDGMSYEDAAKILGSAGTEMSNSSMAGHKTVMYQWTGAEFASNMNAMFQDGKLISKAQFDLK